MYAAILTDQEWVYQASGAATEPVHDTTTSVNAQRDLAAAESFTIR